MEDILNKKTEVKTTSMDDDHNGRGPQWKMVSKGEKLKEDFNGRRAQLKTSSIEDDLNGR